MYIPEIGTLDRDKCLIWERCIDEAVQIGLALFVALGGIGCDKTLGLAGIGGAFGRGQIVNNGALSLPFTHRSTHTFPLAPYFTAMSQYDERLLADAPVASRLEKQVCVEFIFVFPLIFFR